MTSTASRYRLPLHFVLIALTGLLAYANSFQVPFFFDDATSIFDNWVVKDLGEFISGAGYSYNPRRFVGYLTIALNYAAGGTDVVGYHAVNLLIHVVSAWLVYWLARLTLQTPVLVDPAPDHDRLQGVAFIPLVAALLFVAHPVQTQAVTYIVQRFASLCALFYLLSIAGYAKARLLQEERGAGLDLRSGGLYLVALAAAGCAMKTKEIAFTLPFVVVLYEFLFFRLTLRKKLLLLAPVALTAFVVPLSVLGANRSLGEVLSRLAAATRVDTDISRLDYLLTQFPVIATYLRLLVLPINQNLDYDFPIYRSLLSPAVFLSLVLLLALVVLAVALLIKSRRPESRLISFGILWFFITLSVESSVIPIVDVIFEHRVYLPSAGAFVALAAAASLMVRKLRPRHGAVAVGAVVLLLAGATYARNEVWRSELVMWGDVVEKSPEKARPHHNLALALYRAKRYDEALRHVVLAARLDPTSPHPHTLMGSIRGLQGDHYGAMSAFNEAIRLDPQLVAPRLNLGDTYRLKGYTVKALEQYQVALKLAPTDASIYHRIGTAHAMARDMEKAEMFFQCAASVDPSRVEYRQDLMRVRNGKNTLPQ